MWRGPPCYICQPPALLGEKSSGVSSATPEDTTSPAIMLWITVALSPMFNVARPIITERDQRCTDDSVDLAIKQHHSGPTGIRHLPSPLQTLCVGLPNSQFRHDVLRRRLHAAGLCSQHRGCQSESKPTSYVLLWWGGQMANNWPLLPRNPAWHCSPLKPTSPDSTLNANWWRGGSVEQNPYNPGCHSVTLDTYFTFDPHAPDCV